MGNKTYSDGTVTLGRPSTKLAIGTRVVTKVGEHGVVVEPGDWRLYDDECVVELDGGRGRWVFSADDLVIEAE